jgi:SAM-dependent methyltransferase
MNKTLPSRRDPMNTGEYEIMYRTEEHYWWYVGIREIARTILDKYMPRGRRLKILDAGCGTGGNLVMLDRYGEVFGVELSRETVRFLKSRNFFRFATASVTDIPYRGAAFDLVDVFYVNECLQDDSAALREYYRVLKPGGFLYMSEVAFEALRGEHDLAVGIKHRYTRRDLTRRLESAGFCVLRTTYANTILCPPIFLLRRLRSLLSPVARPEEAKSDFDRAPGFLHGIFKATLVIEARLLKIMDLPFGVTVIAVAQKAAA